MIARGKIGKYVVHPLGADFEKSHFQSWEPLRNAVHDHVVKRAHGHQFELREGDGFVLEVVEEDRTSSGGMNANGQVQSAGRLVERKEIGIAQQEIALRSAEKDAHRTVLPRRLRFVINFVNAEER